jgi:hypothetical protein
VIRAAASSASGLGSSATHSRMAAARFAQVVSASGAYGEGERRTVHTPPLLFDLAADPGERFNIAAARSDIVADLIREVEMHRRTVALTKPLFDELLPTGQGDR